ncbi:hypothetical protein AVEN_19151-1 [Araneus ventricosus]|uniref:Transposase Tc1-like domain-containing protein n=1 Tax=Araneus ventricosus TaxID=182803 RepID=A0A4Y2USZ3_ARAVE|nr:hypothetical protein AVEN_19151-1 [Araneus ventricosus]
MQDLAQRMDQRNLQTSTIVDRDALSGVVFGALVVHDKRMQSLEYMQYSVQRKAGGSTLQWSVYKGCPRTSESISIVGVMQKRSDLSDVQKGMIIGFRAKGGSISETANFLNFSRAAVVKIYRAWQYGTIQNQRRGTCGAPRPIDGRGERRLRRCVRANRLATVEQLTAQMNQGATKSVSSTTVQRTLLRIGLRSRRLVNAPMLTAVHRQDNTRCHTDRSVCAWFEEHQDEFTVPPGQQTHRI